MGGGIVARSNAQRCDRVGRCSALVQLRRRFGVDAWLGKRQMDGGLTFQRLEGRASILTAIL
jgi:hypothetical protein